jgi:hypothetical protein
MAKVTALVSALPSFTTIKIKENSMPNNLSYDYLGINNLLQIPKNWEIFLHISKPRNHQNHTQIIRYIIRKPRETKLELKHDDTDTRIKEIQTITNFLDLPKDAFNY